MIKIDKNFKVITSEAYNLKIFELLAALGTASQQQLASKIYDQVLNKTIPLAKIKDALVKSGVTVSDQIICDLVGFLFYPLSDFTAQAQATIKEFNGNLVVYQQWSDQVHSPYNIFQDDFDELFDRLKVNWSGEQRKQAAEILVSWLRKFRTPEKVVEYLQDQEVFGAGALSVVQANKLMVEFSAINDSYKFLAQDQVETYLEFAKRLEEVLEQFPTDEEAKTEDLLTDFKLAIQNEDSWNAIIFWRELLQRGEMAATLLNFPLRAEVIDFYEDKFSKAAINQAWADKKVNLLFRLILPYSVDSWGWPKPEAAFLAEYLIKQLSENDQKIYQGLVFYDVAKDVFSWIELKEENGQLVISANGRSAPARLASQREAGRSGVSH
ncbi:MAG: hypothetical protein NTV81_03030 [Candidatus Komeilibacteria bacterium]|nr:hypothetical protein [Candidatus Komeilibacteria bacterium]